MRPDGIRALEPLNAVGASLKAAGPLLCYRLAASYCVSQGDHSTRILQGCMYLHFT